MALLHCTLKSKALNMNTDINIVLPEGEGLPARCPVLYLLHGASDNYSNWLRNTRIEAYASEAGLAAVMPSAHLSFYNDMALGHYYYTYISVELPRFVQTMFPVSLKREDTFVAGLSMGGYGALRIGLSKPERYAAVGSFSAGADMDMMNDLNAFMDMVKESEKALYPPETFLPSAPSSNLIPAIFGDAPYAGTEKDPRWLARDITQNGKPAPMLYITCGTRDALYGMNEAYREQLDALGFPYAFEEWEDGHTWPFWDESVRRFIGRLELRKGGER